MDHHQILKIKVINKKFLWHVSQSGVRISKKKKICFSQLHSHFMLVMHLCIKIDWDFKRNHKKLPKSREKFPKKRRRHSQLRPIFFCFLIIIWWSPFGCAPCFVSSTYEIWTFDLRFLGRIRWRLWRIYPHPNGKSFSL